jgi:hypothetical protein
VDGSHEVITLCQIDGFELSRMSAFGLQADMAAPEFEVRFAPESGHRYPA